MTKKNILIVDAFREAGGEEEVAFYIYSSLSRDKYNVFIMGPHDSPYFKKKHPKSNEYFNSSLKGKKDIKSILYIRKIIQKSNIDVVNVHGYTAGFMVRIACIGLNVKVVWTMHVNILDIPNEKIRFKRTKFKVEQFLNKYLTDNIICVAKELKDELIEKNKKIKTPIDVIYNGIDTSKFFNSKAPVFYRKKKDEIVLGFISRLSIQKGIPYLLKLAKRMHDNKQNFTLLIIGDGDQKEYIANFVKKYNLTNEVKLYGFQKDVVPILKSIDVLLLPSLFEGFPMIILEALCSGTPVIASNVNGVPEIIKNSYNGFLVAPKNVTDLYSSVEYYINHPSFIKKHGDNGKQLVMDNFDKSLMLNKYEKIFDIN